MTRRLVLLTPLLAGCTGGCTMIQPANVEQLQRSSITQPFEVWHDTEHGVTCYRVRDEGISCLRDEKDGGK